MRFQTQGTPDAAHAGFADTDGRRHGACAPVGGVSGPLARGHGHDALRQAGADDLRPGASFSNPATPSARKRSRQRETFFGVMDRPAYASVPAFSIGTETLAARPQGPAN